jgi:hypothetical protein
MGIELSVIVPGIRVMNWTRLYNSIPKTFSGTWEIIFISPYDLPSMLKKDNVGYIKDWGSPIKCQQRGLVAARGDWVTWAADDGTFVSGALDKGFEILRSNGMKKDVVVTGKYLEGVQIDDHMQRDEYYHLGNHNDTGYVPKEYYMLNVGLVSRELLLKVGGWDCRFEVCPMAYNDLAIRLQNYGAKFILQPEVMFECGHTPLEQGDHGPIHRAQTDHDIPIMKQLYSAENVANRVKIELDNWKDCEEVWQRRFGKPIS